MIHAALVNMIDRDHAADHRIDAFGGCEPVSAWDSLRKRFAETLIHKGDHPAWRHEMELFLRRVC